jgi:hypothetical protein
MAYENITDVGSLDTKNVSGLIRTAWTKKTRNMAILADPLVKDLEGTALGGVINFNDIDKNNKATGIPNKVVIEIGNEVSAEDREVARTIIIALQKPLSGAGIHEDKISEYITQAEDIQYLYANAMANDLGHSVKVKHWGLNAREALPLTRQNELDRLMFQWLGETKGRYIRQAIIFRQSENLENAPFNRPHVFNPNVYFADSVNDNVVKVAYSANNTTYNNAVCAQGFGATLANSRLTISNIMKLCDNLAYSYVKPIMFEGQELYFMYIAEEELTRLSDPKTTDGIGDYIKTVTASPQEVKKIAPRAKYIINNRLILVDDPRLPKVDFTSATGSSPRYVMPGRVDQRNTALPVGAKRFYANMIMGENALFCHNPESIKRRTEKQYLEKLEVIGYAGALSYNIPMYDLDLADQTDSSLVSEGSAVLFSA